MINFDFIISGWNKFNKVQKTASIIGIGAFTYLLYVIYYYKKQSDKKNKLRKALLQVKKIQTNCNFLSITVDPNNIKQQKIFEELVELYIANMLNITEKMSKKFYKAFASQLNSINDGNGVQYNFHLKLIGLFTTCDNQQMLFASFELLPKNNK